MNTRAFWVSFPAVCFHSTKIISDFSSLHSLHSGFLFQELRRTQQVVLGFCLRLEKPQFHSRHSNQIVETFLPCIIILFCSFCFFYLFYSCFTSLGFIIILVLLLVMSLFSLYLPCDFIFALLFLLLYRTLTESSLT